MKNVIWKIYFKYAGSLPALFLFHLCDLLQPAPVSLLAREARRHEGMHYLQRQLLANNTRSEAKHVAVVMFA